MYVELSPHLSDKDKVIMTDDCIDVYLHEQWKFISEKRKFGKKIKQNKVHIKMSKGKLYSLH